MKKIYILLTLTTLLATATAWSQTTYTWDGDDGDSWQTANNWIPVRNTPAASDILLVNNGGTRRIINLPTDQTISKLIISNGTQASFASNPGLQTLRIGNGIAVAGDEFVIENGSSLTQENTFNEIRLQNNASAGIAGTYTIQAAEGFYLNNTGVVATVTGTLANQGDGLNGATAAKLIFNGGTYQHLFDGGTIPTAAWNAGSSCEISGMTDNYPGGMGQTFQNVIFNSTISGDVEMTSDLTCLQNLTIAIGFGTGDDFRGTEDNGNRTITVGGKFTLSSGRFVLDHDNGGSDLNVAGDFEISGTATLTEDGSGSADVTFNGTTKQAFTKATTSTISGTLHFTVNGNAKVDFGTSVLNGSGGNFTLSNNGKIITAHANGLGATGSIQVTGTKSYNNNADYEFQGASTGSFTTTNDPQVRNFTVNNAAGQVILSKAMTVNGVLELSQGYLTTTTNLLTVGTTGTSTTANSAFVNGPLAKVVNSANTAFSFYVGTVSGGLRTIGATTVATAGAGSTTFTARFFNANPKTAYVNAAIAAPMQKISTCEYWTLDRSTGGTKYNAKVTLTWNAASDACGSGAYVTDPTKLVVARHNGLNPGTWTNAGYFSSAPNSVTSADVTNFSPFTIGTTDAAANPLPVLFGDVKAYEKSDGVQIEWSNLTEKDVAEYTIERSTNGRDFTAMAKQLPTSNQDDKASYVAFDAVPNAGANYYRIKAEETTGKIVYSKILSVKIGNTDAGLRLYPNPVSGNQVTISLSNVKNGNYNLRVVNAAGQDVFKQVINNHSNSMTQTLDLPSTIKPGLYNLIVVGDDYRATRTFIVQ
jgi:hypothetical protein